MKQGLDNNTIMFSIRTSIDDKAAEIHLRSDEPITYRMLIHALKDLAKQIEEEQQEETIRCLN